MRGNEATVNVLATVLLQLTQCTGKVSRIAIEGMRAVALLLEEMQTIQATETITTKILEALTPTINKLAEAAEEMRRATAAQTNIHFSTLQRDNAWKRYMGVP